jgi:hypothetical protein
MYTVIWCAQTPPPPLPYLALRVLLRLPGLWLSGLEVHLGAPPPPIPHTSFQEIEATAVDI